MPKETIVAVAIVVLLIAFATAYVIKAKRKGQKCIGCPHAKKCGRNACSCGCTENQE